MNTIPQPINFDTLDGPLLCPFCNSRVKHQLGGDMSLDGLSLVAVPDTYYCIENCGYEYVE